MLESLSYPYMQRALVAGIMVGGLCALVGVYVVLKGMSFIGAGISHASLGGIAIGLATGIEPIVTSSIFCILVAWGIGLVSRYGKVKEDTAIGIFFTFAESIGILVISSMRNYQPDLLSYLFGSIIAVSIQDILIAGVASLVICTAIKVFFKDLMFITFDPEMATVVGLPTNKLYFMLITIIAITIVVSIKVVGIVLVSALIVTPAAAAQQISSDIRKLMAISVIFGMGSCLLGLLLSDIFGVVPGAAIVAVSTTLFAVCALISPIRRSLRQKEQRS